MPPQNPGSSRLAEIARYFVRLGFTAFGGPAAHVAMMEEELVNRRKWVSREQFLDLFSAVNFIPGPSSTELAIALGRLRGGWRGLIVAGVCFITPAVLIILPIGWLYVRYHQTPAMNGALRGISGAIVAIIAAALLRLARSAIKGPFSATIAVLATLCEIVARTQRWGWADVTILALAAIAGAAGAKARRLASFSPLPILAASLTAVSGPTLMMLIFLKIGITLFGSGYVLVSYLQSSFVDNHAWLTQQQVLDAVAVGQITPGPLLSTATFVGFLLGHDRFGGGIGMEIGCAVAATAAIFAPAFILIAVMGPGFDRIRSDPRARGALDGMNAAVVGLICAVCVVLARQAIAVPHPLVATFLVAAWLGILILTRIQSTWVLLIAAIIGWLVF